MTEDIERESRLLREAMLGCAPVDGPCPSAAQLARVVQGQSSQQEQLDVAAHCALCAVCFEDWSIAQRLHEALEREEPRGSLGIDVGATLDASDLDPPRGAPVELVQQRVCSTQPERARARTKRTGLGGWTARLALGAMATAAGLVFWLARSNSDGIADELRDPTLLRGAPARPLAQGLMPRFNREAFSWNHERARSTYEIRIFDPELRQVYQREGIDEGTLRVDAQIRRAIAPLSHFYWQIVEHDAAGQQTTSTPKKENINENK